MTLLIISKKCDELNSFHQVFIDGKEYPSIYTGEAAPEWEHRWITEKVRNAIVCNKDIPSGIVSSWLP